MMHSHLEEIVNLISVNFIQARMKFNTSFFVQTLKNKSYQILSIRHAYYTAAVNSDTERWSTGSCEKQLFYIYGWFGSLNNSRLIIFSSWTHFIRNVCPEICLLNGFIVVNQKAVFRWTRELLRQASGIQVNIRTFITWL